MTRWIDTGMDAPDGHAWRRPAPDDCPDCDCCTAALCEGGRKSVFGCAFLLSQADKADKAIWDRVSKCPCSSAEKSGTMAHALAEHRAEQEKV
ncbi:hypothetical protein [Acrocarpospora macrocephala]|nr:hypothetical protein [Acrocarpospora macrocephala]